MKFGGLQWTLIYRPLDVRAEVTNMDDVSYLVTVDNIALLQAYSLIGIAASQ